MSVLIEVKSILGFENQPKLIARMGDTRSTLIDDFFPIEKRRTNESTMVKVSDLNAPVQAIALTMRGKGPQRIDNMGFTASAFEPYPINPYRSMSGADINNWRTMTKEGKNQFVIRKMELNRNTIRLTTEAMTAQVLTSGALDYPVLVDGSIIKFKITFGTIAEVVAAKKWDAADVSPADVMMVLTDIRDQLQVSGYGSVVKFMAGKDAFYALMKLVMSANNDNRYAAKVEENTITIGGNVVKLVSEKYYDPETETLIDKIDPDEVVGYAADAPHELVYSSLDDIDSNFIAVPFWTKAVKPDTENEIRIVSESKPLPVPYTHAIAKSDVMT